MRTYLIVLASALLLAALVTELTSRLFAGNYFALLLVAFLALAVNGLFNARLAERAAQGTATAKPRPAGKAKDGSRKSRPAKTGGSREEGTIKWFDDAKGYGFIIRANGGEIFVHKRSVQHDGSERPQLHDGRKVSFQVAENEKGPYARNVTAL